MTGQTPIVFVAADDISARESAEAPIRSCGGTIALTHADLGKNNVQVRTELSKSLPLIQGDRVQISQVILNLITNAIEAMAEVEGWRKLLISVSKAELGRALVAISDSGPKLPQACAERIFDAFVTANCRSWKEAKLLCGVGIDRFHLAGARGTCDARSSRNKTFWLDCIGWSLRRIHHWSGTEVPCAVASGMYQCRSSL